MKLKTWNDLSNLDRFFLISVSIIFILHLSSLLLLVHIWHTVALKHIVVILRDLACLHVYCREFLLYPGAANDNVLHHVILFSKHAICPIQKHYPVSNKERWLVGSWGHVTQCQGWPIRDSVKFKVHHLVWRSNFVWNILTSLFIFLLGIWYFIIDQL